MQSTGTPDSSGGTPERRPADDDIVRQAVEAEGTHGGGIQTAPAPPPAVPPPAERKFWLDNRGVQVFAFIVIAVFVVLAAIFLINVFRGEGAGAIVW